VRKWQGWWWIGLFAVAAASARGAEPSGAAAASPAAAAEAAYARLSKADEAREAHQWAEAARLYREALFIYTELNKQYPDWQPAVVGFRLNYCRGQIEKLTRLAAASAELRRDEETAAPGAPERQADLAGLCSRAAGLLRAGETAAAREILLEALRLDPDAPAVRLLLGVAQCQAGEYKDAAYVLAPLVAEYPEHVGARLALAAALLGQGRAQEALDQTREALAREPNRPETHLNLARLLLRAEPPDRAAAEVHYRRATALGLARDEAFEAELAAPPARAPEPPLDPAAVEQDLRAPPEDGAPPAAGAAGGPQ